MPAANLKLKHVLVDKAGIYRYNRTVPEAFRAAVGRKMWNLSLGRDPDKAAEKAREYRREHDALLAALRNPATSQDARLYLARQRSLARMAELEAAGAPDGREDQGDPETGLPYPDAMPNDTGTLESVLADLWTRIPSALADTEEDDPKARVRQLATLAAMAFGDQSRVQMDGLPVVARPFGKVAGMQHAAHRAMLDEVLEELDPTPDETPPELRLSGMLERYFKRKERDASTQSNYRKRINRFTTFAGDLALDAYRPQQFRDYIDHLSLKVKLDVIPQYFAPLKTVWKWARKEEDRYVGIMFPDIDMPESKRTVEDKRWQAFDDDQIKEVWRLLNLAWGPDSTSKLTPSRRAAFLMCFRVMLWTGMRPVEVWHLTTKNVKDGLIHITETKTDAARTLPLSKHLEGLPAFLAADGFAKELLVGVGREYTARIKTAEGPKYERRVQTEPTSPESMEGTMRDAFREIIWAGGIKHPKLVLYSAKDTLIRKLQDLDVSDDLMRGVIGHNTGQKSLRNYKTPFGQSKEGIAKMRAALDAIEYW